MFFNPLKSKKKQQLLKSRVKQKQSGLWFVICLHLEEGPPHSITCCLCSLIAGSLPALPDNKSASQKFYPGTSVNQEAATPQKPTRLVPDLRLLAFNYEKYISVPHKPLSLWCFAIVAWTKTLDFFPFQWLSIFQYSLTLSFHLLSAV